MILTAKLHWKEVMEPPSWVEGLRAPRLYLYLFCHQSSPAAGVKPQFVVVFSSFFLLRSDSESPARSRHPAAPTRGSW